MICYYCMMEFNKNDIHPETFAEKHICKRCYKDLSAPGQLSVNKLFNLMVELEEAARPNERKWAGDHG